MISCDEARVWVGACGYICTKVALPVCSRLLSLGFPFYFPFASFTLEVNS